MNHKCGRQKAKMEAGTALPLFNFAFDAVFTKARLDLNQRPRDIKNLTDLRFVVVAARGHLNICFGYPINQSICIINASRPKSA